jgi:hypothetical protein
MEGIVAVFIGMAVRSGYHIPERYMTSNFKELPNKQYFLQFLDMLVDVFQERYCLLYNSYKRMVDNSAGEQMFSCSRCEQNHLDPKPEKGQYDHLFNEMLNKTENRRENGWPKYDIIEDHLLKRCNYVKFLAFVARRNPLRSLFTILLFGGIGFWIGKKKGWIFKKYPS